MLHQESGLFHLTCRIKGCLCILVRSGYVKVMLKHDVQSSFFNLSATFIWRKSYCRYTVMVKCFCFLFLNVVFCFMFKMMKLSMFIMFGCSEYSCIWQLPVGFETFHVRPLSGVTVVFRFWRRHTEGRKR